MSMARSMAQSPADTGYGGVQMDHYQGPSGGTSYQSGFRTSQQGAGNFGEAHGTGFTSKNLYGQRVVGLGATNRSSIINWDAESGAPGFKQN
jgi:hypothetical protein